jgi:[ribosomal protein S5]-alanine N-acetyltransferase
MIVCETPRLRLRRLRCEDAAFILELLNDPDFLHNIGDRQVRSVADAERYILTGPVASYERWGFGLYLLEIRSTGESAGICGLLRRDGLTDPDIGFALLPRFRGAGYAREAAGAALRYGREVLGLARIVAIASPDNRSSMHVLERLGLKFERMIQLPGLTAQTALYSRSLNAQHAQDEE